jgi:thioredoxin-dependent peroxiredoxin
LGATVVGVSGDTFQTLNKFSVNACRSKFPLVADPDRKTMKPHKSALIPFTAYANRTSYVITPDHRVLYVYSSLDPVRHVKNPMNALEAWRVQHPMGSDVWWRRGALCGT